MNVEYIVQPNYQLGKILEELLDSKPKQAVFVSAFIGLQTILRIKAPVLTLKEKGSQVCFVLGIDLGGTSQDVLKELLDWNITVRIVKNRIPGHTFHPKLYLFTWYNKAEIIIGSNNITEGGFFRNYEGAARITYRLPDETDEFKAACDALDRFINPVGPVAYNLTEELLKELIEKNEIPTEAEARRNRYANNKPRGGKSKPDVGEKHLFGIEVIDPPPPLPADVLERLVKNVQSRRRQIKKTATTQAPVVDDRINEALSPAAFYMTLPTLQGENIPGEARIPIVAIELAQEFWGWPDEYTKDVRGERVYFNWRPYWRVWSVEAPSRIVTQGVRMYMYENSSDFRFYARPLVNAKGNLGDVVRIQRIAQPDAEFECVLARNGTAEYNEWIKYCTHPVRNSTRRFGYA